MYQYNQASAGFNQSASGAHGFAPGFQPPPANSGQNWQFNGFQHEAGYENYGNYQNWSASQQQHWNNWNYYNAQQQQQPSSGENSASYQRTLQYVQQCQQQSWNSTNPAPQ